MSTYIKPTLKQDPNRVIIHVDKNALRTGQDPETNAKPIKHYQT